ncbi:MAG: thioredoxin [Alphaproteobacteria bacterium]|nr:thioredoxin [Alphaproteobacteria bacterium]
MSETCQTACPHCSAAQRIDKSVPVAVAKCHDCGGHLFDGHPILLTGETFAHHLATNTIPVVVDFMADWCGPCKVIAPEIIKTAKALEPHVRFAKVDTDEDQKLAGHNGVRGFPTLVIYKHGHEVARHAGAMSAAQIQAWLKPHL